MRSLAVLVALCFLTGCGKAPHIPFDSAQWADADLRTRGRMVDDLLRRELLLGKTRNEVIQLLGEPDFDSTEELTYLSYQVDIGHAYVYDMMIVFDPATRKSKEVLLDD
jgi:hypothetical protein